MKNLKELFRVRDGETILEGSERAFAVLEDLAIRVKDYPEEELFVLNYNQIESPKMNPIVMECRGIIFDYDFNVVCLPLERFFNMGEAPEITENVDVSNSDAYEKVDGSMVKLYNYKDKWHVGTRGTAFAESENYTGELFRDMIIDAFDFETFDHFNYHCMQLDKDKTYILEFTSPLNRIVTPYKKAQMVLLAVRSNITGDEYDIIDEFHKFEVMNVRLPYVMEFGSDEHIKAETNKLKDLQEGFVIKDRTTGVRMKIKSDQYVAVHRLRGDSIPTPKRIINLVNINETDEYLAYFPDDVELFAPYIKAHKDLYIDIQDFWFGSKDIENQKEFALTIKHMCFSWVLFQAKARKMDPHDVLTNAELRLKNQLLTNYIESRK